MAIQHSKRRIASARLVRVAGELLDASTLCAIATTTPRGAPHINTAYFAWGHEFEIVWLSEPRATHSRNLQANPSAAIAVYDSTQRWGRPDRGIQLFGSAAEVTGEVQPMARRLYVERFPGFGDGRLAAYHLYLFRPRRLKLFDERTFGTATFVTARVGPRNRLAWESTEIYQPGDTLSA